MKITKSAIRKYRTDFCLRQVIQGRHQYSDVPKELRLFACEVFINKFFKYGEVFPLQESMFITSVKDDESRRLLLKKIQGVTIYEEAYDELYEKIDDLECLELLIGLKLQKDPFPQLLKNLQLSEQKNIKHTSIFD